MNIFYGSFKSFQTIVWNFYITNRMGNLSSHSVLCLLIYVRKSSQKAEKGLTIYRWHCTHIRQALLTTYCVAIRSVRTFFEWKLTAITPLQIGHLIFIMPSVLGFASNNLLFLQHGHPTCISFSIPLPPSINAHNSMGFYESVSVLGLFVEDAVLPLPS